MSKLRKKIGMLMWLKACNYYSIRCINCANNALLGRGDYERWMIRDGDLSFYNQNCCDCRVQINPSFDREQAGTIESVLEQVSISSSMNLYPTPAELRGETTPGSAGSGPVIQMYSYNMNAYGRGGR